MSSLETSTIQLTKSRTQDLRALFLLWAVPLTVAMAWMLLVWSVHRASPRTLVSFHGLLHAAIVEELGADGASFPPENPFYAGHPVAYYWFFHLLAAQLVRLFDLNVFYAMEALILFATGTLAIVGVALGRKLYGSTLAGVLIGYLVMAGTNPLGVVFALYKVARNGVHLLNDDPNHLWGVVHPVYSVIRYDDYGGLYGPLLNFFLNMTSRPAALAGLLLTILCLYRAWRNEQVKSWVLVGIACALTTAFSPIIGITAGGALMAGMIGTRLLHRWSASAETRPIKPITVLFASLALAAGILAASPLYYHLVFGPSASRVQFLLFSAVGLRQLLTVMLSILPLLAIALWGLLRAPQDRRGFLAVLVLSALVLLGMSVGVSLPAGNHSNMFHAAVVLLAVPAAGAILRSRSGSDATSPRRAALIGVIFLPTVLTLLAAYMFRSPVPVSFDRSYLQRNPRESDLALLYQWARTETDPRSVFVIDPRDRVAVCGNTAEFPAMTGRAIFTEHFRHYIVEPYSDHRMRFEMAVRLSSGDTPSPSDRAYLAELSRPVYLVSQHSEGAGLMDRVSSVPGPLVFNEGDFAVFKLQD